MRAAHDDDGVEPITLAPAWLVDLTIVLGLAVVVLGAWLIKEVNEPNAMASRRAAIAPSEASKIVDRNLLIVAGSLPGSYAADRTTDAVFIDRVTGQTLTGPEELGAAIGGDIPFFNSPVRTTPIEVAGNVAVYGTTWGLGTPSEQRGAGIVIVTFEGNRISREVVVPMGGVRASDRLIGT